MRWFSFILHWRISMLLVAIAKYNECEWDAWQVVNIRQDPFHHSTHFLISFIKRSMLSDSEAVVSGFYSAMYWHVSQVINLRLMSADLFSQPIFGAWPGCPLLQLNVKIFQLIGLM